MVEVVGMFVDRKKENEIVFLVSEQGVQTYKRKKYLLANNVEALITYYEKCISLIPRQSSL